MEPFEALDRAVTSTADVVKGIGPGQLSAPTPCTKWTVGALLNHLIGTLWLAEALLSDSPPRHPMPPGGLPAADLVGADPAAAYAEAAAATLAAARAGDALTRDHPTPLGDMPGPLLAGFATLDIAVHGWDLATATAEHLDLDDDLAAHLHAFAEQALADAASRAGRIGPSVPADPHAAATDRLMAYLGRHPTARP
jgi:uncharacterized protein (TIGR03086 family)